ncbi:MAG: AraC family transcriptional regulator [Kiritimatiellae bacterium]|jgi:YesN/AraC family two-component response regulator|nr:AraC family transcriptional regulator [Kiritimatiellia bacterium]
MLTIDSLIEIDYISSGLFSSQYIWRHPARIIDSYEIILVTAGTVYLQVGDDRYQLQSGDIVVLKPDVLHRGYADTKEKVEFYWLHFKTNNFSLLSICDRLHLENSYKCINLFKQLLHTANTPGYSSRTAELYTALIIDELAFACKNGDNSGSSLAKQTAEWVRINSDKNISVLEVANHFKYNENYISKLFKKTFECGLKSYINDKKIEYAKNLLTSTNYSVKQIAHMMSYDDANLFIKFFKYHEQVSPTEYRNTYCNTHMNNR